jgi:hypothetical protein
MRFQLWLFVHLLGVLAFLGAHGVSMFVLFRIRKERDRGKIADLISLSGETTRPMYVSLGVLVAGGIGAGTTFGLFSKWWMLTALLILLVEVGVMTAIAKPYFKRITEATAMRPSGVPRISDEELAALLGSKEPIAITVIGVVGLLVILWLMVFKPF